MTTLCPVDCRATTAWMRAFSGLLGCGASVPRAVRVAREAVGGDARWSAPACWAAFTVVGDPQARVGLHLRR